MQHPSQSLILELDKIYYQIESKPQESGQMGVLQLKEATIQEIVNYKIYNML